MGSRLLGAGTVALAVSLLIGVAGCGDTMSRQASAPEPASPTAIGAVPAPDTSGADERPSATSTSTRVPTPAPSVLPLDRRATVSLYAPGYDAPGSLVQVVTTVSGAGRDDRVEVTVAVEGGSAECVAGTWRHEKGTSQQCWVTLPRAAGTHVLRTSAVLTSPDGIARRTSVARQEIEAKGVTTGPVAASHRDDISRCGNTTDHVWLTFDDGFLSETTMRRVLGVLDGENVRGRFFATGAWAASHPRMLEALRSAGHVVGNHTKDHRPLTGLDDVELRREIAGGAKADAPALVRPGYGAGAYAARVEKTAAELGLGACYWTVDPRDWAGPTSEQIISRVMQGDWRTPPLRSGGVILLHMTGKNTPEALPGLIASIRSAGLELDPLRR